MNGINALSDKEKIKIAVEYGIITCLYNEGRIDFENYEILLRKIGQKNGENNEKSQKTYVVSDDE